jgi:hypothetical protein
MRTVFVVIMMLFVVGCGNKAPSTGGTPMPAVVPSESGGAKVAFMKAEVGPMTFEERPTTPFPQYLKVWLKIDAAKTTNLRGWSLGPQTEAVLTDDSGRKYTFIADADYNGMVGRRTMNPGESLPMLLLFEPPSPKAMRLTLRLNGRGIDDQNQPLGPEKDIKLEITSWK